MKLPKKQQIPIILQCALFIWGSSALCYSNLIFIIDEYWFQLIYNYLIILLILLVLLLLLSIYNNLKIWKYILLSLFIGTIITLISCNNYNNKCNEINSFKEEEYTINVCEDQKNSSTYNSCIANVFIHNINYKIQLQFPNFEEELHAGDAIKSKLKFNQIEKSQKQYFWQNGICASATADIITKCNSLDIFASIFSFRNQMINTIRNYDYIEKSDAEQLLSAIICGQTIDLKDGDIYNNFKCCGLAHLVAVSGAHLSIVCSIIMMLLKKLKLKKWIIIVLQSVFILSYLICAAIPISALRAAFMAYIALFSFFSKRRPAPLNAIGLCIIILICIQPETCLSVSFTLSAGSTIGIILFSRYFEYWILRLISKCPNFIKTASALTFSANMCSLPLGLPAKKCWWI